MAELVIRDLRARVVRSRTEVRGQGVEIEDLDDDILNGVDLDVASGEVHAVMGPNGAGKSTLLAAATGAVDYQGTVEVAGRPADARSVALVPQNPVIPPNLSVAEYALLGRTPHLGWWASEGDVDRQIVADVLAQLDLTEMAPRPLDALSGGETQRAVLARALTQQTPVLLLDEPTSALDVGHQVGFVQQIAELRQRRPLTVVAAMHDLGLAARVADRMLLIAQGELVADGPADEVLVDDLLSEVYRTALRVRRVDDKIVVLPG